MDLRNSYVLCLALMLSFSSTIHCVDIIKILGQNPEFSTFSKYLTETKLVEQISSAKAVTVLAIDNNDIASLSGKSPDAIKTIISTNIITEYYDEKKFMDAIGSHAQLPTLSTAPGLAAKIYVELVGDGEMSFSSAVQGSTPDCKIVRTVTTQPDVVSVLQVSQAIVKVDGSAPSTTASATGATTTSSSGLAESPKSGVADAPGPSASSPSSLTTFGFIGAAVMAFASIFVSL